jgi:yecA family protein
MDSIDLKRRLTKKERGELEALMRVRDPQCAGAMECSIARLHGFLTNVVSGPMVVPSEWIPVVFGDDEDSRWETMDQARHAIGLLMRFYNEIASDLGPDGRRYGIFIDRIGDPPDTLGQV